MLYADLKRHTSGIITPQISDGSSNSEVQNVWRDLGRTYKTHSPGTAGIGNTEGFVAFLPAVAAGVVSSGRANCSRGAKTGCAFHRRR